MTPESVTWNIERVWSATTEGETEQLRTVELPRFRGVIMLGAAGAGKTTEAARLAERERASGATVRECKLAEFADTSTQLAAHLTTLAADANDRTIFYLDALDEAMVPARGRWLAIKHWVVGELQGTGASIRVTCRSAVWPRELTQVIREFAGNGSFAEAFLQSLSDDDIRTAAVSPGIDPGAFLQRIDASGTRSLAESPLSLRMLIRLHQSEDGLPASLCPTTRRRSPSSLPEFSVSIRPLGNLVALILTWPEHEEPRSFLLPVKDARNLAQVIEQAARAAPEWPVIRN